MDSQPRSVLPSHQLVRGSNKNIYYFVTFMYSQITFCILHIFITTYSAMKAGVLESWDLSSKKGEIPRIWTPYPKSLHPLPNFKWSEIPRSQCFPWDTKIPNWHFRALLLISFRSMFAIKINFNLYIVDPLWVQCGNSAKKEEKTI